MFLACGLHSEKLIVDVNTFFRGNLPASSVLAMEPVSWNFSPLRQLLYISSSLSKRKIVVTKCFHLVGGMTPMIGWKFTPESLDNNLSKTTSSHHQVQSAPASSVHQHSHVHLGTTVDILLYNAAPLTELSEKLLSAGPSRVAPSHRRSLRSHL